MYVARKNSLRGLGSGGMSAPQQLPSGYQMVGFNPQAFDALRPQAYRTAMAKTSAGANDPANMPSIIMAPTYAPAPAPAPKITVSPQIITTTAVSPNLQQNFTPQVSPIFQQSSGSGNQGAGTTQNAPGGQSGAGGGAAAPGGNTPTTGQGINASDLLSILNAQAEQARLEREAAKSEQAARDRQLQEYNAQQLQLQRDSLTQQQAMEMQRQQQAAATEAQRQQELQRQAAAQAEAQRRADQAAQAAAVHMQYTGPSQVSTLPSTEKAPEMLPKPMQTPAPKNEYGVPIAGAVILIIVGAAMVARKKQRAKT
jgi:hypothetical protein